MPDNKNQHFVPRCHLKPFSLNEKGKAINLFNVGRGSAIPNAPVKGQCAKDYLYGKEDLRLERILQDIEGRYARITPILAASGVPTDDDLRFLGDFAFLQSRRTEVAVQRMRAMQLDVRELIFSKHPEQTPEIDVSDRSLMLESLEMFLKTKHYLGDLKRCIVRNRSQRDYVTSDDPAIITNKFRMQKFNKSDFGTASSGFLLLMPLTPKLLLMCYDGGVYTLPDKQGCFLDITDDKDALALNELQYLKASENIYFSDWSGQETILEDFKALCTRRPKSWNTLRTLIPVSEDADGTTFHEVSHEESSSAHRTLLLMSTSYPSPSRWLTKIKYRSAPRMFNNGTGIGNVRKKEYLRG